jgi:hypothetical protein
MRFAQKIPKSILSAWGGIIGIWVLVKFKSGFTPRKRLWRILKMGDHPNQRSLAVSRCKAGGNSLTQEYLRELFDYDPATGILMNRVRRGGAMPGTEAGSLDNARGKIYRRVVIRQTWVQTHRLIWMYMTGEWPETVDHIDGDGLNNRFENLRSVTQPENLKNQKFRRNNKSGHMGVIWNKSAGKWQAQIKSEYKQVYLGTFNDIKDAIAARQAAQARLGFHQNHGQAREQV